MFRIVWYKFRDCFCSVWAKFSGLFVDNPDRIFGTIFGQSRTVSRFRFHSGTDVFMSCGVFWYPNNSMTNDEGTKRRPVLCGFEIWTILVLVL